MKLTKAEIKKLAECSGKHATLTALFNCESCSVLLKEVTA